MNLVLHRLVAVLAALLLAGRGGAQDAAESAHADFLLKVWGTDDGMPMASVRDIAQTPEGYLWVGTLLNGLLRFDGVRFVAFNSQNVPEFRAQGVRRLMTDTAGRVWIALSSDSLMVWSQMGFAMVIPERVRMEQLLWSASDELLFLDNNAQTHRVWREDGRWRHAVTDVPPLKSQAFCADASGNLWFVPTNNVIRVWGSRTGLRTLSPVPGLEGQNLRVLRADDLGRVWAGTERMLARWEDHRFVPVRPGPPDERLNVRRIIPAGTNSVWVEANNRMRRVANDRWVAESPGWSRVMGGSSGLRFLWGDSQGRLWAGYRDYGLIHVDASGNFTRFTMDDGLPSNSINLFREDREGNIWTGYDRGGLVQLRPRLFRVLGRENGLTDTLVSTVAQDAGGAFWIGANAGTVSRCVDGSCTNLDLPANVAGHPSVVTADAAGRVWIGFPGIGLMLWENGAARVLASEPELGGAMRLMLPARDGQLWLANISGVWTWKDGVLSNRFVNPQASTSPQSPAPAVLAEDAAGTVWMGTFGGYLFRWKGDAFERIEPPDRLSLGRLYAMWPARDGSLWIGSSGAGLLRYREGRFRRFGTAEGLPSDFVAQVMMDEFENLWLATSAGIVRVDQAALERFDHGELDHLPASVYGREDGLPTIGPSIEFQPSCWRAKDGSLWFAMTSGVAGVRPDRVRINPLTPSVVGESVRVNDQPVWPARAGAVFAAPVRPTNAVGESVPGLRVGPGRVDLEFNYTGLSLGSPIRVRFRYQLVGLEPAWRDAGGARAVIYRSVPPGEYEFRVMACNSDGQWSEAATLARVEVRPHFYQSLWLQMGGGLLLAGGLALGVRRVTRRRMQRRLDLLARQREMDRERARIAQDLHDDLGAGLTEIGLLGSLAQRPAQAEERVRDHLRHITDKSREMVTSLDEIVWSLNPKQDSLRALSQYFSEYAQQLLQVTPLRCRIATAEELPESNLNPDQRQNLLLAYKEALTNIVRHARAAEVQITMLVEGDTFVLTVADDGCGVNAAAAGPGADGLANMARRLERLGGRCEVRSAPGAGTTVRLILPLDRIARRAGLPR